MALAEARAAWQRTANRCLVQEDAKRAPRLACCSSAPPSSKHDEIVPTATSNHQDIPTLNSLPFTPTPSNMSPNSRWWLQMQPNYKFQKGLTNEYDSGLIDHTSPVNNQVGGMKNVKDDSHDALYLGFEEDFKEVKDEGFVSIEVSKNSNDVYFDSESSWVGVERSTPWWRTADTEELALIVAQRSLDLIENCDLPMPQNTFVKKNSLSHDDVSASLPLRKTIIASHHHLFTHNSAPASLNGGSYCQKPRIVAENQLLSGSDKPLSPIEKRSTCDEEGSKAQLLEALRHSQTRAREAEKVAKKACAEKEDVVKLVFRQASQLFAYKQWLQLLQLENMYFQFKNKQTPRSRKLKQTSSRKQGKRSRCECDVGRYAIVFALGLGLVGAGLFLGWSIGWMLPTW